MVVRKRVERFARVAVPNFAAHQLVTEHTDTVANAVKSADPVTALDVSSEIFEDHTAPLCPARKLGALYKS